MSMKTFAAALIALTVPAASFAQPQCAPRAVVLDRLASGFGETRQSVGLAQGNQVVEVFASQDTGSWTITVTLPNGTTCLVAAGQAFERVTEALPPDGSAS